jgi:hypothetical protein
MPSAVVRKLYNEDMAWATVKKSESPAVSTQKRCQVRQSDIVELLIYKLVRWSSLFARKPYSEYMASRTVNKPESSAMSTCRT